MACAASSTPLLNHRTDTAVSGINTGVFYAVSTLLAQMVLPFYPTESVAIGQIGVVIVVAGMIGSVVGGFLLDKFKRFKLTTLLDYLFSFLAMLTFTFTLDLGSLVVVFANAFVLGFFMTGYLAIGFEFAAEITFPAAEGTTSALLNASAQVPIRSMETSTRVQKKSVSTHLMTVLRRF
ncbi:unnamed protein product [Heligmosomoides polygyrus]|uniref:MFS domain-containing protein n=1 Tax=Heligmosomoides polygyrus TaxID=6339 RepID=A0A183GDU6_HELPZ|nr:unnamed protein product [Heligmosomoides polygyrus]